ncbi:MAG: SDR family NAD(P)-dependent oxidoreductase [Bacilli bacterium]
MSALSGRVALVTGGGRGIGAATATLLASRGAKVAVNYVGRQSRAEDVVRAITSAGGTALAVGADVRNAQVGDDSRFVTGAYIPVNGGMAME